MLLKEISDFDFKLFEQFKMFLEQTSNPHQQAKTIHRDLDAINVDYAFIGGIALSPHNYPRMTEDVDILVSKETFENLNDLIGKGYTIRPGSKKNMYMHIGNYKLPINVLVEGQQEGNFTIPNPVSFRKKINGVWYASLSGLIHLKSISSRPQDIQDILKLIEENQLKVDFAKKLPKDTQKLFKKLFKK